MKIETFYTLEEVNNRLLNYRDDEVDVVPVRIGEGPDIAYVLKISTTPRAFKK